MGAGGDSQSILNEVSNLRQKYDECRANSGVLKGIDPKILAEEKNKNQKLMLEISEKNGVVKSLEQTMLMRDRSYRETNARNKNLIAQLHTQNVTGQEREMLKRALIEAKGELALAQKELRGGSSSIVKIREELKTTKETLARLQASPSKVQSTEKIVTKVVEPTEKIQALQAQLNAANTVITQLRSTPQKTQTQQPQVVYKDRIVTQEKIVYKDRPVEKVVTKTVESTAKIEALSRELALAQAAITNLKNNGAKVVYKDRIVTQEKIVYKDRPVEKVVKKVVYKDRPVEKIVEKVVYKDRSVEKVVTKSIVQEKPTVDENTRRQMDKLALELERQKSLNAKLASDLAKAPPKRVSAAPLPPLVPINPAPHTAVKTIVAQSVKTVAPVVVDTTAATASKKSSGVFRMASDASVYSSPNGKVIETWEARRSFTGSSASNGWIHITGYFVNRVFQPVDEGENLWVKENDTIRR
jgi:hypothetical protein